MNPRLKSSSKWTPLPVEFIEQIHGVFCENFGQHADDQELIVEGWVFPEEVLLRVGHLPEGQIAQMNFEASIEFNSQKMDIMEQVRLGVDAIGVMFETYFQNLETEENIDYPWEWKAIPMNGKQVFVRHTRVNSALEAEANKLLGIEEGLFNAKADDQDQELNENCDH